MYVCVCVCVCVCVYVCMRAWVRACVRECMRACMRACVRVNVYIYSEKYDGGISINFMGQPGTFPKYAILNFQDPTIQLYPRTVSEIVLVQGTRLSVQFTGQFSRQIAI